MIFFKHISIFLFIFFLSDCMHTHISMNAHIFLKDSPSTDQLCLYDCIDIYYNYKKAFLFNKMKSNSSRDSLILAGSSFSSFNTN